MYLLDAPIETKAFFASTSSLLGTRKNQRTSVSEFLAGN
jgi:hypothetical protein